MTLQWQECGAWCHFCKIQTISWIWILVSTIYNRKDQGAVIKRILDPILGQPSDPFRPPTPHLFSSRKPALASHTPRPPPMGVKVGGKILFPPFDRVEPITTLITMADLPLCQHHLLQYVKEIRIMKQNNKRNSYHIYCVDVCAPWYSYGLLLLSNICS